MNYVWREERNQQNGFSSDESKEMDRTRSLFAFPITRFWALHYDLSNHLIDWSSFGISFSICFLILRRVCSSFEFKWDQTWKKKFPDLGIKLSNRESIRCKFMRHPRQINFRCDYQIIAKIFMEMATSNRGRFSFRHSLEKRPTSTVVLTFYSYLS